MHTLYTTDNKGEFEVGRTVHTRNGPVYECIFYGLSLSTAIRLVSALNGGEMLPNKLFKLLEYCVGRPD